MKTAITEQDAKYESLLLELGQKSDRLTTGKSAASLGDAFIKSFDAERALFQKTGSVRLEIKAATDAVTTSSGRNVMNGGVGSPSSAILMGFQNALTTRPATGTSATEYSRFTGVQGAASVQGGEGAAKSSVRPDHSLITQTALTVAGFTKMSRQALTDSAELKRAIDTTLLRSVSAALDTALTSGATGFVGGFDSLATAHVSTAYSALPDAVSECVSAMQVAGFNPDTLALSPVDWLAVVTAKAATDGHYLSGNYLAPLPVEMRGLRLVLSSSVEVGTALVLDSAHCELLVVDNFSVEVGFVGSDFTSNLVTILGETRVLPIFRSVGSLVKVTPAAA